MFTWVLCGFHMSKWSTVRLGLLQCWKNCAICRQHKWKSHIVSHQFFSFIGLGLCQWSTCKWWIKCHLDFIRFCFLSSFSKQIKLHLGGGVSQSVAYVVGRSFNEFNYACGRSFVNWWLSLGTCEVILAYQKKLVCFFSVYCGWGCYDLPSESILFSAT